MRHFRGLSAPASPLVDVHPHVRLDVHRRHVVLRAPGTGEPLILGLGCLGPALAHGLPGLLENELFLLLPGGVAAVEVRLEVHDCPFPVLSAGMPRPGARPSQEAGEAFATAAPALASGPSSPGSRRRRPRTAGQARSAADPVAEPGEGFTPSGSSVSSVTDTCRVSTSLYSSLDRGSRVSPARSGPPSRSWSRPCRRVPPGSVPGCGGSGAGSYRVGLAHPSHDPTSSWMTCGTPTMAEPFSFRRRPPKADAGAVNRPRIPDRVSAASLRGGSVASGARHRGQPLERRVAAHLSPDRTTPAWTESSQQGGHTSMR